MSEPAIATILMASLGIAAFACFTWGTLRHFAWEGGGSSGAWAVSLLSWAVILQFLARVAIVGPAAAWPYAATLIAASVVMWAWTVRRTRATPPTLAFTGDVPRRLFDDGPYRWVRHPFYTSYMLCWVGTALGTRGPVGWCFVAVIGIVYWRAARFEEAKFANSPLADGYAAYRRRTGMFLPRAFLPGPSHAA